MKTKLEALFKCRNHWQWMWITGDSDKESYEPSREWHNTCACCEYTLGKDEEWPELIDCTCCPLNGYAWGGAWSVTCESSGTPYSEWFWCDGDSELNTHYRKIHAKEMVEACNRAIESILTKQENNNA